MNYNKKWLMYVILLILIIPAIFAQTEKINDFNDFSSVTLNLKIDGKINLESESSRSSVNELYTYLTFLPQNDNLQTINSMTTYSNPTASIDQTNNELVYKWNNPKEQNFDFGLNVTITTNNALVIIDEKIQFPLENIESNYILPTEYIDVNPAIKDKAKELANNEDDLYQVAVNVGIWVQKNVNYNLTSLTADAVEKSSWVMTNKQGVCDEITNLFISMMRSLGVPARFISGMAYTNLGNKWESHGWAEVYFPDKGWVPFDITYGQYGWIDPAHIKLKHSADSGESAVRYTWKAIDTKMTNKAIDLNTSLISVQQKISSPLEFKTRLLKNNVGPKSYVPIELEIRNRNNHYVADTFTITKANNLIEDNSKTILLAPGETKKIFWLTKTPDTVERGYLYTSVIEIQDQFHTTTSANLTYSPNAKAFSLEEANSLIAANTEEPKKEVVSKELSLVCTSLPTAFNYESIEINCLVKNKRTIPIDNIEICYEQTCQTIDSLRTEQNTNLIINQLNKSKTLLITATNKDITVSDIISIEVLENPGLQISKIEYPTITSYDQQFNISLLLTTQLPVNNLTIKINNQEVINLNSLDSTQDITISSSSSDLYNKNDKLRVDLIYKDKNNKEYTTTTFYPLEITDVPWYIKLLSFFGLI